MATKMKKQTAAEWLKEKEDDINAQLSKGPFDRSIQLNGEEYSALRRLIDIEEQIGHAANWVADEMRRASKQEKAKEDKLHGWGIEKVPFNFRMDKPLVDALDAVANEKGLKRSDAVREALIAYLDLES